ncbi:MAG: C1 family peptidase [Bacteroidaceae bacterium]|nr:C1 family peptidase [Bacteroidaceae bacterium]
MKRNNRLKLTGCILAALLAAGNVSAQKENGSIDTQMLKEFAESYKPTGAEKALRNVMLTTSVKTLAVNQENKAKELNTYFSNTVNSKGITDQESSGRCWLFTGLNVMRAKMIAEQNLNGFEFSQVYNFFFDQLEKSNLFLQGIIDTRKKPIDDRMVEWLFNHPLSDGGTFTGVADLVAKYGVVPKEAMRETFSSNNTSAFNNVLKRKLREFGIQLREASEEGKKDKELMAMKKEMLGTVYKMLASVYGVPPTTFTWAPKDSNGKYREQPQEYTPKSFYDKFVGLDFQNNYVMLMNDPSRPYWKSYEIQYDRHVQEGHNWLYVNLPLEDIKQMAIASIKDSVMMYFSCDVGKFLDSGRGLLDIANYDYESLFGVEFNMDKRQRIITRDSGSSHAMTLKSVDLDENGKAVKWQVENSWGASSGYKGTLIMTDEWFDEYMFRLVVDKKYAPEKVLKVLEQKPTMLPAWDPMFMMEE